MDLGYVYAVVKFNHEFLLVLNLDSLYQEQLILQELKDLKIAPPQIIPKPIHIYINILQVHTIFRLLSKHQKNLIWDGFNRNLLISTEILYH